MSKSERGRTLYPLVALFTGLFIVVFGLVMAKHLLECSIFLGFCFLFLMIFGNFKTCIKILPGYIVVSGIFFLIYYLATDKFEGGWAMANRLGAVFFAVIPGMNCQPVRMTRALSQIKTPRSVTLGMLIAMSFVPMLKSEVRRVRESMKTRCAGSVLNPKIFYRAFLVPFVMRLVNISDTLAFSVETRGFKLGKCEYSIYKAERITFWDVLCLVGIITCAVLVVVL